MKGQAFGVLYSAILVMSLIKSGGFSVIITGYFLFSILFSLFFWNSCYAYDGLFHSIFSVSTSFIFFSLFSQWYVLDNVPIFFSSLILQFCLIILFNPSTDIFFISIMTCLILDIIFFTLKKIYSSLNV